MGCPIQLHLEHRIHRQGRVGSLPFRVQNVFAAALVQVKLRAESVCADEIPVQTVLRLRPGEEKRVRPDFYPSRAGIPTLRVELSFQDADALKASPPPAPQDTVSWVQARLNRFGDVQLRVDGVLGKRTRAALGRFQEQQGQLPTGEPSPETLKALVQPPRQIWIGETELMVEDADSATGAPQSVNIHLSNIEKMMGVDLSNLVNLGQESRKGADGLSNGASGDQGPRWVPVELFSSLDGGDDGVGTLRKDVWASLSSDSGDHVVEIVTAPLVRFGRSGGGPNDVVLRVLPPNADNDKASIQISRQHFELSRGPDDLRIRDLGSRGGTFLNGVRLPPREWTPVGDGSRIDVGLGVLALQVKIFFDPRGEIGAVRVTRLNNAAGRECLLVGSRATLRPEGDRLVPGPLTDTGGVCLEVGDGTLHLVDPEASHGDDSFVVPGADQLLPLLSGASLKASPQGREYRLHFHP